MLPTDSSIKNPKLHYDILSGSFFWEDEGLGACDPEKAEIFKTVIMYRTYILTNHDQGLTNRELNFCKRMFYRIKKRNANWIGFQKERCSYSSELANRYRRIEKVTEWRINKLMNE